MRLLDSSATTLAVKVLTWESITKARNDESPKAETGDALSSRRQGVVGRVLLDRAPRGIEFRCRHRRLSYRLINAAQAATCWLWQAGTAARSWARVIIGSFVRGLRRACRAERTTTLGEFLAFGSALTDKSWKMTETLGGTEV